MSRQRRPSSNSSLGLLWWSVVGSTLLLAIQLLLIVSPSSLSTTQAVPHGNGDGLSPFLNLPLTEAGSFPRLGWAGAAFAPSLVTFRRKSTDAAPDRAFGLAAPRIPPQELHRLAAAAKGNDSASPSKRKRKRRKRPDAEADAPAEAASASSASSMSAAPPPVVVDTIKLERERLEGTDDDLALDDDEDDEEDQLVGDADLDRDAADELLEMKKVARFEFRPPASSSDNFSQSSLDLANMGVLADAVAAPSPADSFASPLQADASLDGSVGAGGDEAIPLPDIRGAKVRKQAEEELAKARQEQEQQRVKIKRSDKEAFRKLLERQPFADADDSFFEEEDYGAVSALLGELAQPFLGIPVGPLQAGHLVGSLAIVLMAFVEYPGFPLTNLPTPLRDALQGGLGVVYLINSALAVAAVFLAAERGQPGPLWAAKTLSVGGLALDQLRQLPTLEQVERAKSRKGKRAIKTTKK